MAASVLAFAFALTQALGGEGSQALRLTLMACILLFGGLSIRHQARDFESQRLEGDMRHSSEQEVIPMESPHRR
ncbi:hypothetical protein D1832_13715 [Dermacoccus abyssi]|uniref:Uncharacterized protein n=1 Tax=Dermacoccus abyssi TaxID=322596 RepID=A0A417Z138_9MICO|nr:hypothetical protein D1832_13715 [Dermacoccus abyssi]